MNVQKFIRRIVMAASLALPLALLPTAQAHAAPVIIQVGIAPPVLPVYAQPYCPGDGYIWTPGYWAYGDEGYYWVPGTWVLAPEPGFLWTPAYWGWEGGFYIFHGGYWGPHVGFYGGINYGFGYAGVGFEGGEWRGGHFFYNSAVVRFGGGFHPTNVYVHNVTVINHTTVAYNGGPWRTQCKAHTAGTAGNARKPCAAYDGTNGASELRFAEPSAACQRQPRTSGGSSCSNSCIVPREPNQSRSSGAAWFRTRGHTWHCGTSWRTGCNQPRAAHAGKP